MTTIPDDMSADIEEEPWDRQEDITLGRTDDTYSMDGGEGNTEHGQNMIKNEGHSSSDSEGEASSDNESEGEDDSDQEDEKEHPNEDDMSEGDRKVVVANPAVTETEMIEQVPTSHIASKEQLKEYNSSSNSEIKNSCQRTDDDANNVLPTDESTDEHTRSTQEKKYTPSVEHIPQRHQTLKMRLKLKRTVIETDIPKEKEEEVVKVNVKEEVTQKSGKRKRIQRQPMQMMTESKKFLQIRLGNQENRWLEVKKFSKSLKCHSQVAKLLIDCFDALLDGSLEWSSDTADAGLKSKVKKMMAENRMPIPNDSWLPASKRKKKAPVVPVSPPKMFKEESEEDDFEDNTDEFADRSTDEDYIPDVNTGHTPSKRSQPKRRKQSTPRRVIMTTSEIEEEEKKVKPLKVIVSKNHIKEENVEEFTVVKELGNNKKRGRRKSVNSQVKPATKPAMIPPEFSTYPKVYKCRKCPMKEGETYATIELLQRHYETHKVEPKKKLTANPQSTSSSPDGEETEEEAVQRMAKVLISCPDCKKMFFPGRLVQHLRTAHVRVLCEECGGMFSRVAMWEHKKAHRFKAQGKKPYKCDKCNKEFLWQVSLRQHRELHSKERPYICSACGKSFKTLTKMKRHEIIHESVKPFTCPHCQRSFTQSTNLKTHIRTHTGEKPYQCNYCSKMFTHKVSMKTHMKKEHGVDLWRDGPSHRVEEFDDVRCQMKRRKNPQTKSIQNVFIPEIGASQPDAEDNVRKESEQLRNMQSDYTDDRREYEQEQLMYEQKKLIGEQRSQQSIIEASKDHHHGVIEANKDHHHGLIEASKDHHHGVIEASAHGVVEARSHGMTGSAQEMVKIALTESQRTKASEDSLEHQSTEQQLQNSVTPGDNARHVSVEDKMQAGQQGHDMHTSHSSTHYASHYLPPVSTDMSSHHLTHQIPPPLNQSHNHTRYSSNQDGTSSSRYSPHLNMMASTIRQGSVHHDLQQGGMHHSVTHSRYPPWSAAQSGGPQGYIPGEMGPAIINELMKLGK